MEQDKNLTPEAQTADEIVEQIAAEVEAEAAPPQKSDRPGKLPPDYIP